MTRSVAGETQHQLAEQGVARRARPGDEVVEGLLDAPQADGALGQVRQVRERQLALDDVVDGARADRFDGDALAAVAGHDHDRRHRRGRLAAQQVQPLAVRAAASPRPRSGAGTAPRSSARASSIVSATDDHELAGRARRTPAARARRGPARPRRAGRGAGSDVTRPAPSVPIPDRPVRLAGRLRLERRGRPGVISPFHSTGFASDSGRPRAAYRAWHVRCRSAERANRVRRCWTPFSSPAASRSSSSRSSRWASRVRSSTRSSADPRAAGHERRAAVGALRLHPAQARRGPRRPGVRRDGRWPRRACSSTVPELSVNVHASTLGRDGGFPTFVLERARAVGIDPHRLIVEIVEHSPPLDVPSFRGALGALREAGVDDRARRRGARPVELQDDPRRPARHLQARPLPGRAAPGTTPTAR